MPKTITKNCYSCGQPIDKLYRRYVKYAVGVLCAECIRLLPMDLRGDPLLPQIHAAGDVIGPDPRPRSGAHFLRCPTYYDGCNCIVDAKFIRKA